MSIRYQGADLGNVHLENGYTTRRLADGEEVISIKDVEGLHQAIAEALIDLPTPSDGSKFRFLRKHLELTQREAGKKLGIEEQTVSLWERNQLEVPRYADLMMRALVQEAVRGCIVFSEILARLNTSAQASHGERLVFAFSEGLGWHLDAGTGPHVPRITSQPRMRNPVMLQTRPVEGANWYAVFGERRFENTFPLTNATEVTTAEANVHA